MKLQNPIFFILVLIFALVNIVDGITAFFILPGESNPIYLWTGGSIIFLDFLKAVFVILMFFIYKKNKFPTDFNYFMFITILVLGSFLIGIGAYTNIKAMLNPQLLEYASTIPVEQRVKEYFWFIGILYLIPVILNMISFKLFEWSKNKAFIKK